MEPTDGLSYVLGSDFQAFVAESTVRWDKEWMRYLSLGKDYSFYFVRMDNDHYALRYPKSELAQFTSEQMYHTKLTAVIPPHVFVPGTDLVDRKVLEIGCGPGIFGRIAVRFASDYAGIDASQFALSVARLTSPSNARYVHLSERERLADLAGFADTCVSRHFFIHQSYESSLWLLSLLRDLTAPGGSIVADFFSHEASLDGGQRRRATDGTNPEHPSTLYDYQDDDVMRLADDVGLDCVGIDLMPDLETRFARFRTRTQ